jgi:L-amino acid N-acyltransferase YncA
MDFQIRLAVVEDVPAIAEIYNQAIALNSATADISPVSEDNRRTWLAEHSADTHPVFVAEERGGVIGYCSLSRYRPGRMALRYTAEISYYIHEDFRGLGVGSRLIERAIALCPRLNIKTQFAIGLDFNSDGVHILENFGFQKWGHMPNVANFGGSECGHLYYGRRVVP